MNKSVVLIGALLLTSMVAPVLAQSNTSNSSGTNTSNSTGTNTTNAPGFPSRNGSGVSGYNSDVLNQSQQVSNDLKAAEQAFQNAEQPANQDNRRFTRQRKCNCSNPEQVRLEEAKAKANAFLESIKNPTPEMLEKQASGSSQAW
ncbi:MAG: hypothetical protein KME60_24965 [Cyanomargarita calcarea GSE-NOS-MK-12-04C]|jgi:hypothetical protein|uniref:Uncharacterized protein n=1 Tax=Cyanomargarita calcarea GSE-NOS-MK-12-04C TaxID=2839659 RepID=A0A951QQE3_9CYAN|nr:hypothetical protein [Cyanomargarita calcarea GSE-NOS-MK-12-04C]